MLILREDGQEIQSGFTKNTKWTRDQKKGREKRNEDNICEEDMKKELREII